MRAATRIGLVAAVMCLATPTLTAEAAAVNSRTVVLPLNGTFEEPGAEPIDITGSIRVRVVTRTEPGRGGTAHIVSTLQRTTGTGEDTGATYRFAGTDVAFRTFPPVPVTPLDINPVFLKFWPPTPILPPHPVRPVNVEVTLAADGTINAITAEVGNGSPPPQP
ncbi:hypothetical protein ACFWBN_39160 [Streptomyces sp. NPDC059989]|uniref:hypothetical protein n=1 Tax=Streptomyces sp. NPDC059989 TaxID=3347026 RepID=UPI00369437AC